MKKQVINLDDVPTKNDGKCDWYFFKAKNSRKKITIFSIII